MTGYTSEVKASNLVPGNMNTSTTDSMEPSIVRRNHPHSIHLQISDSIVLVGRMDGLDQTSCPPTNDEDSIRPNSFGVCCVSDPMVLDHDDWNGREATPQPVFGNHGFFRFFSQEGLGYGIINGPQTRWVARSGTRDQIICPRKSK